MLFAFHISTFDLSSIFPLLCRVTMAAPAPPVWLPAVPAPGPIALPPPAGPAPAGAPPAGNFGLYTGPERDHGLTWLMRNAVLAEPAAGGAFPVNSFGWVREQFRALAIGS